MHSSGHQEYAAGRRTDAERRSVLLQLRKLPDFSRSSIGPRSISISMPMQKVLNWKRHRSRCRVYGSILPEAGKILPSPREKAPSISWIALRALRAGYVVKPFATKRRIAYSPPTSRNGIDQGTPTRRNRCSKLLRFMPTSCMTIRLRNFPMCPIPAVMVFGSSTVPLQSADGNLYSRLSGVQPHHSAKRRQRLFEEPQREQASQCPALHGVFRRAIYRSLTSDWAGTLRSDSLLAGCFMVACVQRPVLRSTARL